MILHDVNVLVYAYREDSEGHNEHRRAFESVVLSPSGFGYSNLVLSGFLRVVTHPKIFDTPSAISDAVGFVESLRAQPNASEVRPSSRHWGIFTDLCQRIGAKGNIVPDAFLAALAIESGSTWVTADRGFGRFPDLDWKHPLD